MNARKDTSSRGSATQAVPPRDDYEAAAQNLDDNHDYDFWTPRPKARKGRKLLAITLILLIIAGLGSGGYLFYKHHKHATKPSVSSTQNVPTTASIIRSVSLPKPTQQYDSSNLSLGFNYPTNWNITDTLGSTDLTVVSPALQLVNAAGQSVKGQITMTVENSNPDLSMFKDGSATAAIESENVTYTNPTSTQRGSTYISFLHYASSSTPATAIDGIFITGNYGYVVNQYIPQSDVAAVNPIVTITFSQCANLTCSGKGTPISIPSTLWSNTAFSGPLTSMLESLSID